MKCDGCRDNFTAYLEGGLTEAERTDLDARLASCPDCTAALREFEATVSLLRSLPAVELPAGLAERITAAVQAEKLPQVAQRRTRTWWEVASGLAAAAGLLVGVMLWTHGAFHRQPMASPLPAPTVAREATPTPEAPAPEVTASAATGSEAGPKSAAPTSAPRPEVQSLRERRAHGETTSPTHGEPRSRPHSSTPASGSVPVSPPVPAPMPGRPVADAGPDATGLAGVAGPRGPAGVAAEAPAMAQAQAFGGGGATKAMPASRIGMLSVAPMAAPVQGGVQLQVLPPAECVVGEPAWISIGVTSDIQAADAQIRVQAFPGLDLAGAPDGVVYRGSLERGKTVRVPVEIISSRPGPARLRVVLHSDKPELNSPLTVTTPAFAPAPAGQTPRDAAHIEVRLSFDETPLRDAFSEIGRDTGVRVIPGEAVDRRPVTIDFGRGVPLPAALRILADVGGYEVVRNRDTYRIEANQHPGRSH